MIGRILKLPNDDIRKIVFVALALCLVCSTVVSVAAVYLRPLQEANAALDQKKNILRAAGLLRPGIDVRETFAERIETRIVDLETGEFTDSVDPEGYNQRTASRDPELSAAVPRSLDVASIGRRARYAPVYLVFEGDTLQQIILPVHGYGLWSTMYGYLSLESDLNTVAGITFYDHGETPGLGGEIESTAWQARWVGKRIYGEDGSVRLRVIKGAVTPSDPEAEYKIDGISGSTLTGNGVSNTLEYWLGANGFGPFLQSVQKTGV
ncbi:MAG: Na(+)-translocating NADH-quinone reductase subunit C [Gammaproteobacteria bacterium]